nr:MFS transporter [Nocardioides sp. zg-DK7169]
MVVRSAGSEARGAASYPSGVDHRGASSAGALAKYSLLGVTVLGTMSNNIINVPLHAIAADFDRSISATVLAVSAFVLVLAVAMPLTGWLGDRLGRKRTILAALVLMLAAQLAAAAAPNLEFLIGTRAVQGLACSAIPPLVMGMLVTLFPDRRFRMMAAWAAANGVGQALGPPVGGLVSEVAGWRAIFLVMSVVTALILVGVWRSVGSRPSEAPALHLRGAFLLTSGTGLVLVALTAVSQPAVPVVVDIGAAVLGVLLLVGYVLVSRDNPRAMIPPRLIVESRFLRSSLAAFSQMFVLGTLLVVIPLYLTDTLGLSSGAAGLLFFALPVSMAAFAPAVGRLVDHAQPRTVLRSGLVVLIVGSLVTGLVATDEESVGRVAAVCALLLLLGAGVAMVQTPAAAGATRSPAGQTGAALGLFNMLRFSGSTAGTAWVALTFGRTDMLVVLTGCAVVAALGLLVSFVGPNPSEPARAASGAPAPVPPGASTG